MRFIKTVVKETTRPSWLSTVPEGFGESKTGTLKANEWRNFSTIYLPIALVLRWGGNDNVSADLRKLLDNTMSLVQAIVLSCYRVTSEERVSRVKRHLQNYLTNLRHLFPESDPSTNQHMSLHLPEFLSQFGPVHSWWTYPFERLIGQLQQLLTNNKFGMV